MSFYLKPPKGQANLHILTECIKQRIMCFQNLQSGMEMRHIDNLEYLLEDSILDRTGHYVFRLAVLAGAMSSGTFLKCELKLFNTRLDYFNEEDMKQFLRRIIRQLKDCIRANIHKQLSDFYWTLYNVANNMLQKGFLSHVFDNHRGNIVMENELCQVERVSVPFWYCNSLVATRKVELRNGAAYFPCHQWRDILPCLFISYLKIVLSEMRFSRNVAEALVDDRIMGCLKIVKNQYSTDDNYLENRVRVEEIEDESLYFPLCMKNLYDILKEKHRLVHNARFDLSLFFKGIGLSLNDSVKFWKGEYSKQHSVCSKCSHSWQENEKKYIYGIRHLYGLEGSRKQYSARSCSYMQEAGVGINCEGGCPFVHCDDDVLRSTLKKNLPGYDDDIEVMIFEKNENPFSACRLFRDCCLKRITNDPLPEGMSFRNPVEYYNQMKNNKQ